MPRRGNKKRRRRSRRSPESSAARDRAKQLLRRGGESLERGERSAGIAAIEEALTADPTFVEPALVLARLRDEDGDDVIADALVEEAVRRGAAAIDTIPGRPGRQPHWWRDEATRPYLKSLVARGWRRLDRNEPQAAAEQFAKVFEMTEAEEDPLLAGVFAAEAWLYAAMPTAALDAYARLVEGPDVCYGRGLALLASGQTRAATVSLWLGVLLNAWVAEAVLGTDRLAGVDRSHFVGDPSEAEELVGRIGELWTEPACELLARLLGDVEFCREMERWALLARSLDEAETAQRERQLLAEIERFLDSERIEREVDGLRQRLDGPRG